MNCDYLKVAESLGDKEPTDVGGEVGQGVGPASGVHWQHLCGDHPCETPKSQVEGNGEAEDEREWQPGHLGQVRSCLEQLGCRGDIDEGAGQVLRIRHGACQAKAWLQALLGVEGLEVESQGALIDGYVIKFLLSLYHNISHCKLATLSRRQKPMLPGR